VQYDDDDDDDDCTCAAITPTSRYCYKSWACDGDVIDDDVTSDVSDDVTGEDSSEPASSEEEQRRRRGKHIAVVVVSRERCFGELGGHSWGLYGDHCEKAAEDDERQVPAQLVPDTLHGSSYRFSAVCPVRAPGL